MYICVYAAAYESYSKRSNLKVGLIHTIWKRNEIHSAVNGIVSVWLFVSYHMGLKSAEISI